MIVPKNIESFDIEIDHDAGSNTFYGRMIVRDEEVCNCKISVSDDTSCWQITSWFAVAGNGHKGYGKQLLKSVFEYILTVYKRPSRIEYVWNGSNDYVKNWLERHFDAKMIGPVHKYDPSDLWDSHVFILNRNKFLDYFELR